MEPQSSVHLVHDEASLSGMTASLADVPRVAVDTEFHAEHRYRPELMLVQVAAPSGEVWVLDPRATPIRALGSVLGRAEIVVHGGQQDIDLLYRATGVLPPRVLDTQRAAALLGMGYPTRLGTVVQRALGTTISKTAGLTDWSLRPLSARQLQYAAEDARVLLPLASSLLERLDQVGRAEWAWQASQELCAEVDREPVEVDGWLQWEVAPSLDEGERRAMAALFQWREATARDADQPPRQVLSDALALDLARRKPSTLGDLAENRRIPQGLIKRHGAALLGVLKRASADTGPAPTPPGQETTLLAQLVEHWAAVQERETGMARTLLLPRSLALRIAEDGAQALAGWRRQAVGDQLRGLFEGRYCLGVRGQIAVCLDHNADLEPARKELA